MSAKILDGRKIALQIGENIKKEITQIKKRYGRPPHLASLFIGENPATKLYIAAQQRIASEMGIEFRLCHLPKDITQEDILKLVEGLNRDPDVTGIILHFPLPEQIRRSEILQSVHPLKDRSEERRVGKE